MEKKISGAKDFGNLRNLTRLIRDGLILQNFHSILLTNLMNSAR
jgi:hypothetical protein